MKTFTPLLLLVIFSAVVGQADGSSSDKPKELESVSSRKASVKHAAVRKLQVDWGEWADAFVGPPSTPESINWGAWADAFISSKSQPTPQPTISRPTFDWQAWVDAFMSMFGR
mmetsp:Transcript_10047/g.15409  ORF Transcript_10047/g.15409 Transcript_10047/m.15409 type:complete len:113 (+) Transcript_10047:75-413(+)